MTALKNLAITSHSASAIAIDRSCPNGQGMPLSPDTQLSNSDDLLTIPSQYGELPDQMKLLAVEGQWFGTHDRNHRMSWVYSGDPHNPYGGYTFVYQLDVVQTPINRMSFFASSTINASVAVADSFYTGVANGGFIAPSSIDRSLDGGTIGVNWDDGIPLGRHGWSSTPAIVLYTDTTDFHISPATFSYLEKFSQIANVLAAGPFPEPKTCVMMPTGLVCIRKRKIK